MHKNYNYNKIKKEVINIVYSSCLLEKNIFSDTVWQYHIIPVVKYSLILGRELKSDLEILELAAYLHDYASFLGKYEKHHIEGAKLAKKILTRLGMPNEKINRISACIYSHRGSLQIKRKTIEEKIIASADAMSHISELADMFYLTYGVHKYKTEEGAKWLRKKLENDWKKIIPAGKKIIKKDYKIALKIINQVLKK